MCLTLTIPKNTNVKNWKKIAKKDITCYKTLKAQYWANQYGKGIKLESVYQHFPYELGFHYYQEGDNKFRIKSDWLNLYNQVADNYEIYEGLHSFDSIDVARARKCRNEVIVECTIPKGSEYYTGKYNDIASDQLILNKIIQ